MGTSVNNVVNFRMRFSAPKQAPFGISAGMFCLLKEYAWHFFCPIIQKALVLDICLGSIKVCTLISLPLFDLYLIKSVLGLLLIAYSI